jgi:cytochrome c6
MTARAEGFNRIVQDRGSVFFVTVILLATSSLTAAAVAQDQSVRNVFKSTCASCHGQNGVATPVGKSLNAPDLGSAVVQKQTTGQLQQIISGGKGNMPPFKGSLSEAQISSLAAYVRTLSKKGK